MGMTRGQAQDLLSQFASESADYRASLVSDPKGTIEKQFGNALPEGVSVQVLEETADTMYVVLPHTAAEGELDDAALEKVAGGMGDKYEANCGGGVLNTLNQVSL